MTLPFENDTSRIVKRLAKQNMKANRRTSISIMVAILIASTFLCSYAHSSKAIGIKVCSRRSQPTVIGMHSFGDHAGQLDLIQNNENIQTIMVKEIIRPPYCQLHPACPIF